MTQPKDTLPKVPPFIPRRAEPPHKNGLDMRGMLSVATMLASMAALTISMVGAGRLIFDVFNDGLISALDGLLVKVIVLGLTFFFGWGTGLACIRAFGNLVYPIIVTIYAWACLAAVSILYIKIIQKLFIQQYDVLHFWAYLIILLGGLFVLLCLHLLIEDHDLRPFAIPLLIISVLQLFVIVKRYIFTADAKGFLVISDFTIFVVMIAIAALMLMHIGILSPLRNGLSSLFDQNGNSVTEENET